MTGHNYPLNHCIPTSRRYTVLAQPHEKEWGMNNKTQTFTSRTKDHERYIYISLKSSYRSATHSNLTFHEMFSTNRADIMAKDIGSQSFWTILIQSEMLRDKDIKCYSILKYIYKSTNKLRRKCLNVVRLDPCACSISSFYLFYIAMASYNGMSVNWDI